MITSNTLHVCCALVLVACIYGTWQVVAKVAMSEGASPFVFTFYRAFGGTIVMFLSMYFVPALRNFQDRPFHPLTEIKRAFSRDSGKFLVLGVFMSVNIISSIFAVSLLPPITCAIFQPTTPIVAAGIAVSLRLEAFSYADIFSNLISVFGAMVIVLLGTGNTSGTFSEQRIIGFLCVLSNVTCSAAYVVYQKYAGVLKQYAPTFVTAMSFLVAGTILCIPAIYSARTDSQAWLLGCRGDVLGALAYAVCLTTALNYSLLAWANKHTSATLVTGFQTLQPAATTLVEYVMFGIVISPGQAIGGAAIVIGLLAKVSLQKAADEPSKKLASALKDPEHMLLK
eukprot:TRINITY_DN36961_c0_g1_i1.p1 TRINITY_DN36961_c0_g1~~TRINITY_DN36961_c0_g1_i1.p1  ORF type:complete len:340 (-),score=64.51 TRINITY_DN36961_c0_g1_i1:66-1085(-)